nr:MAG TPA: hypothetical protein [Caudoviricetes sp.]
MKYGTKHYRNHKSDCRAEYAPYRYWIYTNSGTAGS